ncbi:Uncharacterized protein OS=Planctomyces brasiliensis (strain ATCC 49424 / DSM 5305 / JCM 21570 / NBRC 103401 / IFAM 1448) GN=Plabr_1377 PE=4 SV=1 [Gemmata massiliana]|uniref:Organic solvent tolerance-like N-terminal domain-containing protein n=1 Tax=Gemmata massiliana TaxID=1210884 RepID=A0A6P2CUD2_9BACT|nr:hypothetical protein [Gemmata massiliana]VTR92579.1 Uncharacterized protein OS=Planctomyces brasiliensis (strain ATCC 49424 / DSM 5305 / JCM 21570 / NBRC 103401 / IFAM 1448) GN=Plabr_1377 PE=4 SV=1 [Gemmata massiliana]
MLTPRRTMLLLAGFVLFAGAYAVYAQLLGWLDGLPQLPPQMLAVRNSGDFVPPEGSTVLKTELKLIEAFGANSPETNGAHYKMQFDFKSGDSSVVVASGMPPDKPNSHRVTLTPFSIAVFSKPKPPHLRQPGEVTEISTAHADKGVLEFDRVINNLADMKKAAIVKVELISDFELALPDPRRGVVHITNNQRTSDPSRFLVLRTVGPVFYRNPKMAGANAAAPDFWTDAPVEIVDRQNLPRSVGSPAPVTAPTKSEDNRTTGAIAAILSGQRLPPPTLTAIGLRVYLEPDPPPNQPKKEPKPGATPVKGVRRIEFQEQVVLNLWVNNGESLAGTTPVQSNAPKSSGLAFVPPPVAIAGLTGGLGTVAYNTRLMDRALLQIDTRGPFAYDAEKALARFDVVPQTDSNLPNDVQVTKIPARGGTSSLFSQVLELEFNGGPTGASRAVNTPAIKRLHAWVNAPGRFVTVASQEETAPTTPSAAPTLSSTQAYGRDLVHEQAVSRTILKGEPVVVVRDNNTLKAGSPQEPATLTIEPGPPIASTAGQSPVRKLQMTVLGAGEVALTDAANNNQSLSAHWKISLVQSKEVINGREQDRFDFTGDAKLEDLKADYWLKGNVIKLWFQPRVEPPADGKVNADAKVVAGGQPRVEPPAVDGKANADTKVAGGGQPKPSRVEAIGKVTSHSTDYDIKESEQLTVHFIDGEPVPAGGAIAQPNKPVSPDAVASGPPGGPMPPPVAAGAAPKLPGPMPPMGPDAPKLPEPIAKAPEKSKPPFEIRAKTIETFVKRIPVAPTDKQAGRKAADEKAVEPPAAKYQLDRARCEDNVIVHQEPTDPGKQRGVDIFGRLLLIEGTNDGSVMTVFGWPDRIGEVHQEEMSLLGPKIVLNQVLNSASVDGRGSLTMPTKSNFAGGELAQSEVVVVHWRDAMSFNGAQRSAVFKGKVRAHQGESSVQCHRMDVVFDRPVYFNQSQKKGAPLPGTNPKDPMAGAVAKKDESAKIDKVRCYPAPADDDDSTRELEVVYTQVDYDKDGKLLKAQWLRVPELTMYAQAQDSNSDEKFQCVLADGPGQLRIWQRGEANPVGPVAGAQPMAGGAKAVAKPAKDDPEMKLTFIKFSGRMKGVDKAKLYQEATFSGEIAAVHVPADSPTVKIDEYNLPPRAVLLTCNDKLLVWSQKSQGDTPASQNMTASGNAFLRSDDYEGTAATIENRGNAVTLTGSEAVPARFSNRFRGGNEQIGKVITYDRGTGASSVKEGSGGSIGSPPKNRPATPAPKK